jgi:hypothetical protein
MPASPSWASERGRLTAIARHYPERAPEVVRELKAGRLADHIARAVAEAPSLTRAQLDRIAGILASAPTVDADAFNDEGAGVA